MEDWRVLPQDILAEQSVLGSIFISPDKLVEVSELVRPEDFYRPSHQLIFKAMIRLSETGEAIDATTMRSALESQGDLATIGGIAYLAELVSSVPTSANVVHYARIVAKKAQLRAVISQLSESVGDAYAENLDLDEIIAKAEQGLLKVRQSSSQSSFRPIYDVLMDHQSTLDERANSEGTITGTPTGFYDLDKLTTGLHKDNLIILAARPAMGKTALALNIAQHVATSANKPVAIFSLEMGDESLVERMIASLGMVQSHNLRTGKMSLDEWQRVCFAQSQLSQAPIFIDDTAGVRITDIKARARKLCQENGGLGLIVIDYLQLIQGSTSRSENRQQEISEISRQLKVLSKDLEVPVIALSQLSRNVEQRQDKRPLMSDLRESGSIEQDADIVAFLYRDDYYQDHQDDQLASNLTELIIRKNRHGSLGTVKLYFHKEYTKFSNVREDDDG